ncbi:hypothetical protein D3D02_00940 [Halobellus sp. Atlit-38R]|uniref:hypothetical protein n=1 Tax=Halobellus sp. Atlit-38R TaxID=2282131 RepID=UPI000EF1AC41|nr:hypothetical protein [Halobellus sp. Atlit-38R]RLM94580.1 hypothetical protein D3D02_00940 [Halobellus sp. Atlit-38R]
MDLTRAASVVVAVALLSAGCLGVPNGDAPSTSTSPPESTPAGTAHASEQPDPNKEVRLENAWNRSVEIHVRVVRETTNETVHEATYTLEPGAERDVYNLSAAEPTGIEPFRIVATARNTTESVTIETSACYGNAYVEITDEGELYPYYAIC